MRIFLRVLQIIYNIIGRLPMDNVKSTLEARIRTRVEAITGGYKFEHWDCYEYEKLSCISSIKRAGRSKDKRSYNDCLIMADTESSKRAPDVIDENHLVAWTISIRAYGINIVTLWGHKPTTMMFCIKKIMDSMSGDKTIIYFHNLSWDYHYLRRFLFQAFGTPERALNTKPHYPIYLEFSGGLILKDSLILCQKGLEKWATDLDIEHKKAVGSWDYNKIRSQREKYSEDELHYIENDTLAGVECLDATRRALHKHTYNIPLTATGIVREGARERGRKNRAREWFKRVAPKYEQYIKLRLAFHGGYTHANRHFISKVIEGTSPIICYDYASDYPYCMIAYKFPRENFHPYKDLTITEALEISDKYAILAKLILVKPHLKDDSIPMPGLQFSKCYRAVNPVCDNGRILAAGLAVLYLTEYDLMVLEEQYDYDREKTILTDIEISAKDYLPKWYRDYVFELFKDKCRLKSCVPPDPVNYQIRKGMLNACYGMSVQSSIQQDIIEKYDSNVPNDMYYKKPIDEREEYQKYLENHNHILPYWIGVWTTSIAFFRIFELGKCVKDSGTWLYTDTDSCFAEGWDEKKLDVYNNEIKAQLQEAGYGPVIHEGREYWLGVAERDKVCNKFVTLGAKRYAYEDENGEIKITVAGVPKKGREVLGGDLHKFVKGLIFPGEVTGKKLHTYFYREIHKDDNGNIVGDSVDLSPTQYELDDVYTPDWEKIWYEDIETAVFDFESLVD